LIWANLAIQIFEANTMLLTDGLLIGNKRLQEIANGGKPMRPGFPKEEAEAVRKVQKALAKIMGPMPKSYPTVVA
jgi:hypothetical protein